MYVLMYNCECPYSCLTVNVLIDTVLVICELPVSPPFVPCNQPVIPIARTNYIIESGDCSVRHMAHRKRRDKVMQSKYCTRYYKLALGLPFTGLCDCQYRLGGHLSYKMGQSSGPVQPTDKKTQIAN